MVGQSENNYPTPKVRLTGFCPDCGAQMRYWVDPMVPLLLERNEDPSAYGCEFDCWMCLDCRVEWPTVYRVGDPPIEHYGR